MQSKESRTGQAWLWAAGINLVVFGFLWMIFLRVPAPSTAAGGGDDQVAMSAGAGETFGQMTHLVGQSPGWNGSGIQTSDGNPQEGPLVQNRSEVWIDEFYLDRGPAISFAPRLNPDGTPRSIPSDQQFTKGPTYEDQDTLISSEDINFAQMNPSFFPKSDLPEEFRQYNYRLSVQVEIDASGHVVGTPVIVRSSSNPVVDQLTIDKIMHEATFTPATRKDNRRPVPSNAVILIIYQ
jgi:hypothetical protein